MVSSAILPQASGWALPAEDPRTSGASGGRHRADVYMYKWQTCSPGQRNKSIDTTAIGRLTISLYLHHGGMGRLSYKQKEVLRDGNTHFE
jgi:hypothetical protein